MALLSFRTILTTSALCLAAWACVAHAALGREVQVQAEQHIRSQWQNNPKLRYHSLTYKGTLQECRAGKQFYVQNVRTLQGTWIPVQALAPGTLVFRGEVKVYKTGKTKGGAGYFFCTPETGECGVPFFVVSDNKKTENVDKMSQFASMW